MDNFIKRTCESLIERSFLGEYGYWYDQWFYDIQNEIDIKGDTNEEMD